MLNKKILIATAALVAVAGVASAQGRPGRPHPGERPDAACAAGCREEFRACNTSGRAERQACHERCGDVIATAREACAGSVPRGEPSAECVAAREGVRVCLAPCREGFRDDRNECVTKLRACVTDCPTASLPSPPPPIDRACIAECRRERHECHDAAREPAAVCREACSATAQTSLTACGRGRPTEACRTARADLHTCLEPCRAASAEAIAACGTATAACVQACHSPAEPDPVP